MLVVARAYADLVTDFPDWQAAAATQSPNQFPTFIQTLAPGLHPGGIVPVYSWSSLNLICVASAGAAKAIVTHWADLAGTQQVGADQWGFTTTTALAARVPLRGPFCQLSINVTSAGNLTAETWAAFLTADVTRISFPVGNQQVTDSRTLTPGQVVKFNVPIIASGPATWSYNPFDTSGKLAVAINSVDELGNLITIVSNRGNPAGLDNAVIYVPDQIIQVQVTNTDGAANHGYGLTLTVPSY